MSQANAAAKRTIPLTIIIPGVLTAITAVVLTSQISGLAESGSYVIPAIVYGMLTALSLMFGVWLSQGSLSPAHIIGMVTFLSQPEAALPLMVWAMMLGSLLGAVLSMVYGNTWRSSTPLQRVTHIVLVVSRVTLSFFAAAQVYLALNGMLPLTQESWQGSLIQIDLLTYVLVYLTMFAAVFVLQLYVNKQPVGEIVRSNLALIAIILVLPTPFAILSAEVTRDLTDPSEVLSLTGLVVIVIGLHALSRSEFQLRNQLNEMTALAAATHAMRSQLDVNALTKTIYEQVASIMHIKDFTLLITRDDTKPPDYAYVVLDGVVQAGNPYKENAHSIPDAALSRHVLKTGEQLLIQRDMKGECARLGITNAPEQFSSWMAIPLSLDNGRRGVLAVASRSARRRLNKGSQQLLSIVVDSASIAIDNARLFRKQADQVGQMVTLNNITALLSGSLKPDEVLDTLVSSASTLSDANAIALYLREDDKTQPVLVRSAGFSDSLLETLPAPLLLNAGSDTPEKASTITISDVKQDTRIQTSADQLKREGFSALVELPLASGSKSLGMVVMYFQKAQTFTTEWVATLETYATHAVQAIENARKFTTTDEAFQRSMDQLLTLAGIGQLLTATMDLRAISTLVLQHAIGSSSAARGFMALFDKTNGQSLLLTPLSVLDETISDVQMTRALAHGAAAITQSNRLIERRVVEPPNGESPKGLLAESAQSQLSLPIMRGDVLLGLLLLESDSADAFDEQDSHFLSQVVNQAVIAIENAHLFEDITSGRDRLQTILDTMDAAILLVDKQNTVTMVNPRVDLLGLKPEQLRDRRLDELVNDETINIVDRMRFDNHERLTGLVSNVEDVAKAPHVYVLAETNARRFIQRQVIPVRNEEDDTLGVLLVFYDKTSEQELLQAREELTRMIVHDLRSPLTAVTTSLKLLRDYVKEDNEAYSLVQSTTDSSRRAVKKLLSRVNSMLDIAKMESGRMPIEQDVVDLAPVIDSVIEEVKPLAQELDITLKVDLGETPPLLDVDEDKIERLFQNLLDNALKYSPMSSTIEIKAHPAGQDGAADGFLRVDVIDCGPGVPEDFKDQLFQSYVQVEGRKRVRNGVGLGLSFCRMVTEAHGGTIWVEDNQPKGSIFAVTLPVFSADDLVLDETKPDTKPLST